MELVGLQHLGFKGKDNLNLDINYNRLIIYIPSEFRSKTKCWADNPEEPDLFWGFV